jgi:hypothetical protein
VGEANSFSSGFYLTAYVSGFGDGDRESQQKWAIAMSLLQNALVQLSLISPLGEAKENL